MIIIELNVSPNDFKHGLRTLQEWKDDPAPIEEKVRTALKNLPKIAETEFYHVVFYDNLGNEFFKHNSSTLYIKPSSLKYSVFNRAFMILDKDNRKVSKMKIWYTEKI